MSDPRNPSRDRGGYSDVYFVGAGRSLFQSLLRESGGWVLSPVLGHWLGGAGAELLDRPAQG